jgi:hypothetical protein
MRKIQVGQRFAEQLCLVYVAAVGIIRCEPGLVIRANLAGGHIVMRAVMMTGHGRMRMALRSGVAAIEPAYRAQASGCAEKYAGENETDHPANKH